MDVLQGSDQEAGTFISGRWLVATAIIVSLAMAGGGWWYRYMQIRQSIAFWGSTAGTAVLNATDVRDLEFGLPSGTAEESAGEAIELAGRRVVSDSDLSKAPGLIHLQYALTRDGSFDWSAPPLDWKSIEWERAIEFKDDNSRVYVFIARDFGHVGRLLESGEVKVLACPKLAPSLAAFFEKRSAPAR